jgi:polyhydroxyalkanoic acid synthase PhaR subunit
MSEHSANGTNTFDPLGLWKTARDTNLEMWSKLMVDLVNSDEYARTSGAALEQYLAASQPFRDALERTMTQTLATMNMPSRAEVSSLAERLVNIEMRLDDMDAKLSNVHKSLQKTIMDTVKQTPATPDDQLKALEANLDRLNTKLDALLIAVGQPGPEPANKRTSARSRPAGTRKSTKKVQEGH